MKTDLDISTVNFQDSIGKEYHKILNGTGVFNTVLDSSNISHQLDDMYYNLIINSGDFKEFHPPNRKEFEELKRRGYYKDLDTNLIKSIICKNTIEEMFEKIKDLIPANLTDREYQSAIITQLVAPENGFDSVPLKLSKQEWENLNTDDYQTIYRGFKNIDHVHELKNGSAFYGSWSSGNAIYFTENRNLALILYAENKEENLMVAKFRKSDLITEDRSTVGVAMFEETKDKEIGKYFLDVGTYAITKNYDALTFEETFSNVYAFLNRTKLIIY